MSTNVATKQDIQALKDDIKALAKDNQDLNNTIQENFNDITSLLQTFMQQVDDRFQKVEKDIVELKDSHNRLLNTIDGFVGRIDKYETELAARDSQFEKLLAWARKVSEKTGVPLENL